jgi:hypothetical protein
MKRPAQLQRTKEEEEEEEEKKKEGIGFEKKKKGKTEEIVCFPYPLFFSMVSVLTMLLTLMSHALNSGDAERPVCQELFTSLAVNRSSGRTLVKERERKEWKSEF